MPRGLSPRRRQTRYFMLRADAQEPEIARISPRGAPSFFDAATGSWVQDPLLGAEIRLSDEWVATDATDLPQHVDVPRDAEPPTGGGRRGGGRSRRGRHAQPG